MINENRQTQLAWTKIEQEKKKSRAGLDFVFIICPALAQVKSS